MIRRLIVLAGIALAGTAAAQPVTPPTPMDQALGARLMREINAGLTCDAGLLEAQQQIATLKAQIAELTKASPPK